MKTARGRPEIHAAPARLDMEHLIGGVLLLGVLASCALTAAGLAWHALAGGHAGFEQAVTAVDLRGFLRDDVRQVASGAARPRLLIDLGMAVLFLTPYVRVAASVLYFGLVERSWKYTVFTGFVLAVLTYSLFLR